MKQLLIYSQRAELRDYLEKKLHDVPACHPVFCDSPEELLRLLELFQRIDILVVDKAESSANFAPIDEAIRKNHGIINYFCLWEQEDAFATMSFHPLGWEKVVTEIAQKCGDAKAEDELYTGIRIETLSHFLLLPFPLFIRLDTGRFVKRFPAYEDIDHSVLTDYIKRGIREFFFEYRFGKDFINLLMNNMFNRLEASYETDYQRSKAQSDVYRTVREILSSIGAKPRVVELCDSFMNILITDVLSSKEERAYQFLHNLRHRPEMDFQYRLIQLTGFIGAHIIESRARLPEKEATRSLLTAAFFSHISLKDPEQVHFHTRQLIDLLPPMEKSVMMEHAAVSAEIMRGSKLCPKEVIQTIREHHGDPTGLTVPPFPEPEISELSRCLIVAEALAYALLVNPDKNHWKIFRQVLTRYEGTFLEEYLLSFEETFLNYVEVHS